LLRLLLRAVEGLLGLVLQLVAVLLPLVVEPLLILIERALRLVGQLLLLRGRLLLELGGILLGLCLQLVGELLGLVGHVLLELLCLALQLVPVLLERRRRRRGWGAGLRPGPRVRRCGRCGTLPRAGRSRDRWTRCRRVGGALRRGGPAAVGRGLSDHSGGGRRHGVRRGGCFAPHRADGEERADHGEADERRDRHADRV